jgi:hypothetical protein
MQFRAARIIAAIAAAFALALGPVVTALAHEERDVGAVHFKVGWNSEPTYVGFNNAVQVTLTDKAGNAIPDATDTLKVEVTNGSQKSGPLALQPFFDADSGGNPGEYLAPLIPTRPGNYTFHFTGTVKGQTVDQSFTSSDQTFDPVKDSAAIEFPAKDPSSAELAQRLQRDTARTDTLQADLTGARQTADRDTYLAIGAIVIAVVLGGAGLAVGARRRRAV